MSYKIKSVLETEYYSVIISILRCFDFVSDKIYLFQFKFGYGPNPFKVSLPHSNLPPQYSQCSYTGQRLNYTKEITI
jgi:hypothetical protein